MVELFSLRRFLSRRAVAATVALMLLAALLDGVSVGLALPFLALLDGDRAAVQEHRFLQVFVGTLESSGLRITLLSILVLLGAVTFARTVVRYLADNLSVRVVEQLNVTLRVKTMETLMLVSPAYFATTKTGDLTQTLLDDTEKTGLAVTYLLKIVAQGAMIIVWVAVMALFSWQLTVMSLAIAIVMTAIVRFRSAYSERAGREVAAAKQALSSAVVELLSGLRVIWLTASERTAIDRLRRTTLDVGDAMYRLFRNTAIVNAIGENISTVALLSVVYLSVARFRVDIATLVAFFYVLTKVLPQVHRLNVVRTELRGYAAHATNVLRLLSLDGKPMLADGTRPAGPLASGIEFRDVSFQYRHGEPVLRNVWLNIPAARTTAIAGASGAGKSTIAELLARFYDPDGGEILVDGVRLQDLRRATWRCRLGVVSQDVFLFNDTIRNNITFGAEHAEPASIEVAARLAHAHEFIMDLPRRYDTRVGDRGFTLSGGQRQRIALARALVRKPDVLLLDEATSALDAESERLILDAIERLSGTMAILIIGHRLASLRQADHIYVLDGGRIAESGTHAELVASGGQYARYCHLQQV